MWRMGMGVCMVEIAWGVGEGGGWGGGRVAEVWWVNYGGTF